MYRYLLVQYIHSSIWLTLLGCGLRASDNTHDASTQQANSIPLHESHAAKLVEPSGEA